MKHTLLYFSSLALITSAGCSSSSSNGTSSNKPLTQTGGSFKGSWIGAGSLTTTGISTSNKPKTVACTQVTIKLEFQNNQLLMTQMNWTCGTSFAVPDTALDISNGQLLLNGKSVGAISDTILDAQISANNDVVRFHMDLMTDGEVNYSQIATNARGTQTLSVTSVLQNSGL